MNALVEFFDELGGEGWKKFVFVLWLKFEEVYVGFYKGCEQKGWVGYVTTLTWSKAKRKKVIGQLAMTHALSISITWKLANLLLTSITSLCLGPKTSCISLFLHRTLYVVRLDRKKLLYQSHVFSILIIKWSFQLKGRYK